MPLHPRVSFTSLSSFRPFLSLFLSPSWPRREEVYPRKCIHEARSYTKRQSREISRGRTSDTSSFWTRTIRELAYSLSLALIASREFTPPQRILSMKRITLSARFSPRSQPPCITNYQRSQPSSFNLPPSVLRRRDTRPQTRDLIYPTVTLAGFNLSLDLAATDVELIYPRTRWFLERGRERRWGGKETGGRETASQFRRLARGGQLH